MTKIDVHHGDCIDVMATLPAYSVDAIITDPPAGIAFMGREWDKDKGGRDQWIAWMECVAVECLRVAKPGAHALVWALPRTSHWTVTAWENAGWEVRDRISHLFGTGFPKGLNVVNNLITLAICQYPEYAPRVVQSSKHIQVASSVGKGRIAAALVQILPVGALGLITEIGGEVALHVPMDTWPSGWADNIGLNMIWSWNGSLDDVCDGASKSITLTASATTTDETIFNWLTGLHTSATTTRCSVTLRNGSRWPALIVEQNSSVAGVTRTPIQLVSALGDATWQPLGKYAGFNVALKPAMEDWWLLRKPLSAGTVAANVLAHGTGAINVDACRVATDAPQPWRENSGRHGNAYGSFGTGEQCTRAVEDIALGRWPANVMHDGSPEVLAAFAAFGERKSGNLEPHHMLRACDNLAMSGPNQARNPRQSFGGDTGTAARFFPALGYAEDELRFHYCAKASKADRAGSKHPTVKPVKLIRWLARLITPPGGTILDPFAGSGTLAAAATAEGFNAILIEREAEYHDDIVNRIAALQPSLV